MEAQTKRLNRPVIQKILSAAEATFAEQGFTAARVDDVAARAGVAKSHLYYHFSGKEQLLNDLIQWRISQIIAEKDHLLREVTALNPETLMVLLRQAVFGILMQYRAFIRVALLEAITAPDAAAPLFEALRVLLEDSFQRFKTLGIHIEKQQFMTTFYYFGIVPAVLHIATGQYWASATGMTAAQLDEVFIQTLAQLELTALQQYHNTGGSP